MATETTPDHQEALKRIARAREHSESKLSLAGLALGHLPQEMAALTALQSLDLSWCGQLQDHREIDWRAQARQLPMNIFGCRFEQARGSLPQH